MKTIWKFEITPDNLSLAMPQGAVILCVREQHDNICLWAEVESLSPQEERIFEVFGTGHEIHEDMGIQRKYLGTAIIHDGSLVFHVYERIN